MNWKELLSTATATEQINTNNGWGFGGMIAKKYSFENDMEIIVGKYCFRHAPSQPILKVYKEEKHIESYSANRLTEKQIKKLFNL